MKSPRFFFALIGLLSLTVAALSALAGEASASSAVVPSQRPRVIVSSDIGGTDFDDFQSFVHLFAYGDRFEIEGLIASPWGQARNRAANIHRIIDEYAKDFPNYRSHAEAYPTPDYLHLVTKQGASDAAGLPGFGERTEGSDWIIRCAHREDARPLWVLVWGGIDDVAQAVHDDPGIKAKLRIFWVGGPNKKWSTTAYDYLATQHPDLWIIEANSTYRGLFTGGDQTGDLGNESFVASHVRGRGALGDYFCTIANQIKMGDSPSVLYLLGAHPEDPSAESWAGHYVRAWERERQVFVQAPTKADTVETFSIVEIVARGTKPAQAGVQATLESDRQVFPGYAGADGAWHFVLAPKEAKTFSYQLSSSDGSLNGQGGAFTSINPAPERAHQPCASRPHWWTDDPNPMWSEGPHQGAKLISQWRGAFLKDFAERLERGHRPASASKPRVFVLTDIENEPDDAMSMVRYLVYANQFETEGLVATTSIHQRKRVAPERIRQIVRAYGKVRANLALHEAGFPSEESLLSVVGEGLPVYGLEGVGEGKDSPGSEALCRAILREDPRPLWVPIWGGPNVLAQALWKLRATLSPAALAQAVARVRVYAISDQDDTGPWLRREFPGLFYICSPGFHAGGAYHHATWSGISGDNFHGRFAGADFSVVTNEWLEANIRRKGPLGAEYPRWEYLMEGDTPSYLNLIGNGLSDPEHPEWGGWGGRYELYTPKRERWHLSAETRPLWTDAQDEVLGVDGRWHTDNHATIWRWRVAFQNDFAARMDWTIKPYAETNHPPVVRLGHADHLYAKPGERVDLSAEGSYDPDGQSLSYEWFYYDEAGSLPVTSGRSGQSVEIRDNDQVHAWLMVPRPNRVLPCTGDMHVILAVTDHGVPRLTRYRRVIITVREP